MNFSFKSLLAAVLLLCSTVATAHDFEVGGIFYNITSGTEKTVEVTYKGDSYSAYSNEYTGDVTVPSTIAYNGETYSVTSIGYMAFYNCFYLVSIEIPGSVTSIGNSAFSYCFGLTSIEIPGSVTSIGNSAFDGCSGLTSIIVDGNNRNYDSREGCNAIIETASNTLITGCKNTVIPGSVTSIGDGAFFYCSGLTSVTSLATTAPGLGSYAFYGISSDATLYYPAGSDYSSWARYFANIEEITEEFPEEEEVFGDLNGDGTVSVSDIQVLVNIILGN